MEHSIHSIFNNCHGCHAGSVGHSMTKTFLLSVGPPFYIDFANCLSAYMCAAVSSNTKQMYVGYWNHSYQCISWIQPHQNWSLEPQDLGSVLPVTPAHSWHCSRAEDDISPKGSISMTSFPFFATAVERVLVLLLCRASKKHKLTTRTPGIRFKMRPNRSVHNKLQISMNMKLWSSEHITGY